MSYHVADGFLGDCLIKYGALKVTIVAMVHVLRPVQFVVFFAHFHLGCKFQLFYGFPVIPSTTPKLLSLFLLHLLIAECWMVLYLLHFLALLFMQVS